MSQHHDQHLEPADEVHEHDRGLAYDLPTLLNRRRALTLFGGAGLAAALAACSDGSNGSDDAAGSGPASSSSTSGSSGSSGSTSPSSTGSPATGSTTEIPAETGGPFPGDGSNGVNVLTESGIVRSDLTRSFGSASGVAEGVPLTVRLTVLDIAKGAVGYEGAAVYVWHCDREGGYSLYTDGVTEENYCRGVQAADANGEVTFTSIFPAAYQGRWPHIHFEVYPSLAAATKASDKLRTSQLALPEDMCKVVYATKGYEQSVDNLARTSLASDNVFSDGWSLQLATVTGDVDGGMTATLNVPV
jgi:protocatechuate 3,4-dioxygenase beta subunit